MGTLAPEVKRLTLSQRLNGKNGRQNTSLTGFLRFFCDVSRCHAICLFLTRGGGDCHMKGAGNFKFKPLKKTNLGVGKPFLDP